MSKEDRSEATSQMKVTECWTRSGTHGKPMLGAGSCKILPEYRPAILMWREDYDALQESLKHRTELYWKLTAEFDAMRKELEELRADSYWRNYRGT